MDLEITEHHRDLRDAARRFLTGRCPTSLVRQVQAENAGHSPRLWSELARDGWLGMGIPARSGGAAADLFELGIFYEETGRVLLPASFYATVHAALLIDACGNDQQRDRYLTAIAAGELVAAVAYAELAVHRSGTHVATLLTSRADGALRLDGRKAFAPGAAAADLVVMIARIDGTAGEDALTAVLVDRTDPGVEFTALRTLGHDGQVIVALSDVRVEPSSILGHPGTIVTAALADVQRKVTALHALEMVGGAQRVLEMSVDHAGARQQFGMPIGGFQAVRHQVADVNIAITAARLAAQRATWLLSRDRPAGRAVSVAKAAANEAYVAATLLAHQLHGGMGYVREHDLHLWSQRARTSSLLLGTTDDHLDELGHRFADDANRS
jgi:alkylation response protein AidB-like acyl-CoA dehydrogenase